MVVPFGRAWRERQPWKTFGGSLFEVVLRACSLPHSPSFCAMIGFSFEPRLAFQMGGTLTLVMVGVLVLKARRREQKTTARTELWLYLEKDQRPPKSFAQFASSTVLRETYMTTAYWTALISVGMWIIFPPFLV
ncbi:MAG: hypothetical protein R3D62_09910 [Xanthobacteraceae bacterium]